MSQALTDRASGPLNPPCGLNEIMATFGDIFSYLLSDHSLDPRWQAEYMVTIALPFPLVLSWDQSRSVERMTCHRLLQPVFERCFGELEGAGLQSKLTSFGGCFSFRPQHRGTKLSTHSWGIAIDLDPELNPQGSPGHMDAGIVKIFREAGFKWGGEWQGAQHDPMHFQFCTGY
jgi:hypothetical protein